MSVDVTQPSAELQRLRREPQSVRLHKAATGGARVAPAHRKRLAPPRRRDNEQHTDSLDLKCCGARANRGLGLSGHVVRHPRVRGCPGPGMRAALGAVAPG